jgi:hypothetical protein
MSEPTAVLVWTFWALAISVGGAFAGGVYWAHRRLGVPRAGAGRSAAYAAVGTAAWMALTYALAASGRLAFGPMPPPLGMLFVAIVVGSVTLGTSRVGGRLARGLPLAALVGVQAFRLPLEVAMHRAYTEGVMPVQMSYAGWNFDVLSGIGALVVAVLLGMRRAPLGVVRIWNWMAVLLLTNVLVIAWLSTPTPFRVFATEPANVWITHPPFVWLPSVLVFAAILGHVLIFRRLRFEAARGPVPAPPVDAAGSSSPQRAAIGA